MRTSQPVQWALFPPSFLSRLRLPPQLPLLLPTWRRRCQSLLDRNLYCIHRAFFIHNVLFFFLLVVNRGFIYPLDRFFPCILQTIISGLLHIVLSFSFLFFFHPFFLVHHLLCFGPLADVLTRALSAPALPHLTCRPLLHALSYTCLLL